MRLLIILLCFLVHSSVESITAQDYEEDISLGGYHPDDGPEIILNPGDPGPLEVNMGGHVYSRCSVRDNHEYSFKWIRRLPDHSSQEVSSTAVLYLSDVRVEDMQHPLYCQVTRLSDGQVFEKVLNIRMVGYGGSLPAELTLTIRSLPAEDLSAGRIMRQCLFENNEEINQQFDFRWLDQNGRVVTNGDALYLMLEDPADLGNYTCEATHRSSSNIYQAKYHVTRSSRAQASQYIVTIVPDTTQVLLGRPYEMLCRVEPMPSEPVSFRWYHKDRMVGSDARLRLPSLTYPDLGSYVCRAEWTPAYSRTGSMAANATVDLSLALTKEAEIEMSPPPGSVLVTLPGETRELHCEYGQLSNPSVQWFFEGQPLERHPTLNASSRVYRMDRLRVSIITLRGVEVGHGGTYECRVNGQIKQTHVIVRVEDGLEVNPSEDTVDEGTPVEFHCRAHGADRNVNQEMQWFYQPFSGGPVEPVNLHPETGFVRQDHPYASHTSFISRLRARKSDEGIYICRLPSQGAEARGRLYVRATVQYRVVITPSVVKVRVNNPIEMECYVMEDTGRPADVLPTFSLMDSRIRFEQERVAANRVRFIIRSGLGAEYNGTQVRCSVDGTDRFATSTIVIEDTCPHGFRRCRSGDCLPAGRFCDGVRDCADGSDEDPRLCNECEPTVRKCEYYQNRAPLKSTHMVHWICDGEDDCGNGFDEANCPDPLFAQCGDYMFTCPNSQRRIPRSFVCDKDQDCEYGEDERNCAGPTIESSGNYRHSVRAGTQVVLTCRVTGHPLPRVIWRFNWGCLPENDNRYRVTSVAQNCDSPMPSVVSTLTISNVRPGDDGIYNCEGLAGSMRAMSNDYFVMIEY
ncbi:unnamed protein product [Echinostoma caproni]|uniref:Basement membrane-specific heparan sulfate proteoglycan core protein-like n=1 Tax=Echinostoma caproni TaxID=27848 RepID=A0A183A6H7_9TREM|nr:unnamed protein product [Echinostoma caproni]